VRALACVLYNYNNDYLTASNMSSSSSTILNDESMDTTCGQQQQQQHVAMIDERSVYVGNVDYSTEAVQLEQHFAGVGAHVNRVTINCDKFTGAPKG
jgi:hypothetical protein